MHSVRGRNERDVGKFESEDDEDSRPCAEERCRASISVSIPMKEPPQGQAERDEADSPGDQSDDKSKGKDLQILSPKAFNPVEI
jgi:hypothetical protein